MYVTVCVRVRVCVCVCAYMWMNERNKNWFASVLVGRSADEGVGFKRNKCWCCSVIFVKKKQIIKREEGPENERKTERVHETIEGLDILRDLHEHKRNTKKKKCEKRMESNTHRDSLSTWTLPWSAPASASGGAKERKKERKEERKRDKWECESERRRMRARVRRVVLLNCTGCKMYSLSVSKEKKRILI